MKRLVLILLSLIFLACAYVCEKKYYHAGIYVIDYSKFEKELFRKEYIIEGLIEEIRTFLMQKKDIKAAFSLYSPKVKALRSEGISLLVYQHDTLKYWTNNSLPISNLYIYGNSISFMLKLSNGWYLVERTSGDMYNIVGLITIKTEFPYQNKFLKNAFHPDYGIPNDVKVSFDELGYPIRDKENKFLFYLVPPNEPFRKPVFKYLSLGSYMAFFILLILLIYNVFISLPKRNNLLLLGLIGCLFLIRCLMMSLKIPLILYSIDLFNPNYYAASILAPSFGDMLIHTIFLLIVAFFFWRFINIPEFRSKKSKLLSLLFSLVLLCIYFIFVSFNIHSLICDSTIPFRLNNILNLNYFSVLGYLLIAFQLISFILFTDKIIQVYEKKSVFKLLLNSAFISLIIFFLVWIFKLPVDFIAILFIPPFIWIIAYIRFYHKEYRPTSLLILIFIASLFTLTVIETNTYKKTTNESRLLAINLANERDFVGEYLLQETSSEIKNDTFIMNSMNESFKDIEKLTDYLQKAYFSGYFRKYDIQVSVCEAGQNLLIENTNEIVPCVGFFNSMASSGISITNSKFYYVDNFNGRVSYLGIFDLNRKYLFITLDSKILTEQLGYPELLLDQKIDKPSYLQQYSYAKYHIKQLITQSGQYIYSLNLPAAWDSADNEFNTVIKSPYKHLIYKVDKNNTIVLSYQMISLVGILMSFSYIYLFYFVLLVIIFLIGANSFIIQFIKNDFKNRIRLSVVVILLLSFVLLGGVTIFYNTKYFERKQNEVLSEKIKSILVELEYKIGTEKTLDKSWESYLTSLLRRFSNIFFTDINLYNFDGELLATSRPEIFDQGLIGTRMNQAAFRHLILRNEARFVQNENIGNLSYLSAYVPLKNIDNEILAYLNLPYFTRQGELRDELVTIVAAIINIYILLIFITLLFSLYLTNRITRPLMLIRERIKQIDLSGHNDPINFDSNDEIGSLIKEYNRMVVELKKSVEELARSERETAWREMAKQIAHEIKNPLTPMRLSIQHMMRTWDSDDPEFRKNLKKTLHTLIEQIDNLSHIATEFSNFAKMPKPKNEVVNIVERLKSCIGLFNNYDTIRFETNFGNYDEINILADSEELLRAITNLIKNAIQAIPAGKEGLIRVSTDLHNDVVRIGISDNGQGIPDELKDKLFQPNFTTKSAGMGLGLAIAKNIIEYAGGKIWFETKFGEGTIFYIEIPLYQANE